MPIDSKIRELIKRKGTITIDVMMREVLSINPLSYYKRQEQIGYLGDFTTAPEISQLFGEIIGLWVIECWQQTGKPSKTSLVELGPGRGTLMRDLLKVAKLVPEFYQSLSIELVEINKHFLSQQRTNLANSGLPIRYHSKVEDITDSYAIIITNEFFDSMPIKQYIKVKELWYESVLMIDPVDNKIKFDKIGISKELQSYLLQTHSEGYDGAIIEESYESIEKIKFISNHIQKFGGGAIIIDYGYDVGPFARTRHQYNPTLQAIKNHKYHPVLETLGEADLSAHVDFYALKSAAQNFDIEISGPVSQHDFLIQYGILLRSKMLKNLLPKSKANIIDKQVDRLISETKMGALFKVLCLRSR